MCICAPLVRNMNQPHSARAAIPPLHGLLWHTSDNTTFNTLSIIQHWLMWIAFTNIEQCVTYFAGVSQFLIDAFLTSVSWLRKDIDFVNPVNQSYIAKFHFSCSFWLCVVGMVFVPFTSWIWLDYWAVIILLQWTLPTVVIKECLFFCYYCYRVSFGLNLRGSPRKSWCYNAHLIHLVIFVWIARTVIVLLKVGLL